MLVEIDEKTGRVKDPAGERLGRWVPDDMFDAMMNVVELASYAQIVGGCRVNGPEIRKNCDAVFAAVTRCPDEEACDEIVGFAPPPSLAFHPDMEAVAMAICDHDGAQ